ncbi:Uncharacterised protein [Serratia fonticola]|nr:Uncharacterised protein [Serratia fonticola]CAI1150021.1 Uncharacterised protein [Serratia fonticola]CAI1872428.1 Uncharacterised protein [Serratia fonticola]
MNKFKYIILFYTLLIFGCHGGYIENLQIKSIVNMSNNYCNGRGLKGCESYHLCIDESYDKMKKNHSADISIADSYIILYSPSLYDEKEYSNLMNNAYKLITPDSRYANDPAVTVSVGYLIYAHNACASITGDKTYNIDSHMPLLREKLGVK